VIDDHPGDWGGAGGMTLQNPPNSLLVEPNLMLSRAEPRMLRRARLPQVLDGDTRGRAHFPQRDGWATERRPSFGRIERPEAVIWMTVDAAEDEPVRLWTRLATVVERLGQGLGPWEMMR
jgi:hypothetical protein